MAQRNEVAATHQRAYDMAKKLFDDEKFDQAIDQAKKNLCAEVDWERAEVRAAFSHIVAARADEIVEPSHCGRAFVASHQRLSQ